MLNNRIVQVLIAALVIFAICWIAKVNFNVNAGSSGIGASIDRGE